MQSESGWALLEVCQDKQVVPVEERTITFPKDICNSPLSHNRITRVQIQEMLEEGASVRRRYLHIGTLSRQIPTCIEAMILKVRSTPPPFNQS